jgi:flagellar biosynthetic protein FliP
MVANQPATIESETKLSNEVRAQIGLAVSPQNKLSTYAGSQSPGNNAAGFTDFLSNQSEQLTSPNGIQSSIKVALLLATLSLAPAIILMTTCYIRVIVVLSLLRQAFGGQQLPPTQVMTALSVFLTFLIMTPVWSEVKTSAIDPYTQAENGISWEEAWNRGVVPVRKFMIRQIEMADNGESIELFYKYLPATAETQPTEISDVPLNVLLPAFMISELKVAFLLGFQIYLPFLVLDLVVSSVTVSMGMLMLPPNMISFPLKLILFVLVDGWNLVVGMLLQSFQAFT